FSFFISEHNLLDLVIIAPWFIPDNKVDILLFTLEFAIENYNGIEEIKLSEKTKYADTDVNYELPQISAFIKNMSTAAGFPLEDGILAHLYMLRSVWPVWPISDLVSGGINHMLAVVELTNAINHQ
ncbi:hypothetical protein ACJX0J_024360, partial [Zea mays]